MAIPTAIRATTPVMIIAASEAILYTVFALFYSAAAGNADRPAIVAVPV